MNLNEFKSADPKPWLRINAGVGKTQIPLRPGGYVTAALATVLTLTAEQAISGVLVVLSGRTAGISLPLTAEIDTYTGSAVDGTAWSLKVINREEVNSIALSSVEVPAQLIPKAIVGGYNSSTEFHFVRVAGSYICLNS